MFPYSHVSDWGTLYKLYSLSGHSIMQRTQECTQAPPVPVHPFPCVTPLSPDCSTLHASHSRISR